MQQHPIIPFRRARTVANQLQARKLVPTEGRASRVQSTHGQELTRSTELFMCTKVCCLNVRSYLCYLYSYLYMCYVTVMYMDNLSYVIR